LEKTCTAQVGKSHGTTLPLSEPHIINLPKDMSRIDEQNEEQLGKGFIVGLFATIVISGLVLGLMQWGLQLTI
jgi:hypothetical protein